MMAGAATSQRTATIPAMASRCSLSARREAALAPWCRVSGLMRFMIEGIDPWCKVPPGVRGSGFVIQALRLYPEGQTLNTIQGSGRPIVLLRLNLRPGGKPYLLPGIYSLGSRIWDSGPRVYAARASWCRVRGIGSWGFGVEGLSCFGVGGSGLMASGQVVLLRLNLRPGG